MLYITCPPTSKLLDRTLAAALNIVSNQDGFFFINGLVEYLIRVICVVSQLANLFELVLKVYQ